MRFRGITFAAACCLAAGSVALAQSPAEPQPNQIIGKPAAGVTGAWSAPNPHQDFWVATGNSGESPQKGAWVGISASPAAPALRHQLKLREGIGLVVDFVEPKSPADEAGIKQYDLLEKLDDQLLINTEQFAVLVRTYKPDDEIKLTLLREGKRETINVKLAERDLPNLNQFHFDPQLMQFDRADGQPRQLNLNVPEHLKLLTQPVKSLTWVDGQREITITNKDGHSTLVARDVSGKKLFEGRIDSEEQRNALPTDVRDTLKKLKMPDEKPAVKQERHAGDKKPGEAQDEPGPDVENQQ